MKEANERDLDDFSYAPMRLHAWVGYSELCADFEHTFADACTDPHHQRQDNGGANTGKIFFCFSGGEADQLPYPASL